jgi:hypothetical protein
VKILLDHILVSPGNLKGTADFSVKKNTCIVEGVLYEQYSDDLGNPDQERGQRSSDHRPVSVVLKYSELKRPGLMRVGHLLLSGSLWISLCKL